ncbi:hypothetical protein CONCODRAFT_169338 [Conidiobolus coronatus NRRL 28638]|uniref:Calcium-channel protein CCH1 n=1 Tax=Conidiobolus coronatus (strain ATCC 28846 / CBS 209.66 / NRRL 28638) TaxID=796925 RepID=A0A137PAE8_CONC2|nr:hypothetical protein CONCODRAFT_169338 [Conidiobolus coronatus NRRL 28638]|eukprot:KXN71988.1 hypothetical protein CONCODRAFT_169338 [Conidiobolus coronatus NRRL 28638]
MAEPEVKETKFGFILATTNPLVKLCKRLIIPVNTENIADEEQAAHRSNKPYKYFNNFMLIICWLAILAALIDIPWYELNNGELWVMSFNILDGIFTAIFTIEFLIKITALGVVFDKDSYFRNAWNVIDFCVVVPMWIDLLVKYLLPQVDINYLNAFRSFRVLRLITSSTKLQQTIYSLFVVGFGGIFNVILLGAAFTIPYAIYGHQLFGNMLHSCNDKEVLGIRSCAGPFIEEELGILIPRAWNNPRLFNFDNFGSSFLILLEILSREKWIEVMQITMGIRGKNLQPELEDSWFSCFYFIGFYLLGSVFVLTMFITIVIENYRNYTGVSLHTANQRRYIDLFKQINQITPSKQPKIVPKSPFLNWCYQTSVKKSMDIFDALLILLLLVSCMHFFGDNPTYDYALKLVELGILILLFAELPINILGIGWKNFFSKLWDIVYFSGVIVTICLRLGWVIKSNSQCDYFAKIGQVALFLRLITINDQLIQLANIMSASILEILNFLYIWFIFILLYSIAFNQMFGLTRYGHSTDNYANFRYIWTSILLLFRLSTGEFWNEVMHDFAVMSPHCVRGATYLESDCGNETVSYILFISFNIISMYILTNVLIVLILDNFSFCYDIAASFSLLSRSEIRDFKTKWRLIDEDGTGYLKTADIVPFLKSLDSPFETKLFPRNLEIHYLIMQSQSEKTINFSELTHKIDNEEVDENMQNYYHWISKRMNETMDQRYLQLHRRNFNMIYKELVRKERKDLGIPITDVLLTMAHYKIVNPEDCFLIEDVFLYYKDREEVLYSYRVELAIGLMKTYLIRKKFLKRLNKQNSQAKGKNIIY